MTQYRQDNIDGIDEAIAVAEQRGIDETCRQMHLAREFCRWGKYASFSKDPEFKRRYLATQLSISLLMGRGRVR